MLAVPSRHRSVALLGITLAAQLLLLAVQIRRGQQVRLIRVWAVETVTPIGRAAAWFTDGIGNTWSGYIALRHMRTENQQLRGELDRVKLRDAELQGRAAEADRLSALLGFKDAHTEAPMLGARVISGSPDSRSRAIFLSRGSRDGIKRDMGVITAEGVVGKVLAVYPDTSQVLLLSDKESGVGALLSNTRTQAPVRGSGDPLLGMEYVSNDVKVDVGETVLTSGQDRIFPKDLPVGTVVQATPDKHGSFQQILVKPAARLDRLEEVLVLMSRQDFNLPSTDAPPVAPARAGGPGLPRAQVKPAPATPTANKSAAKPAARQ